MTKGRKDASKKRAIVKRPLKFPAFKFEQSGQQLYLFFAKASLLYSVLAINRRVEDKDEGYQRALSPGRVQAIAQFIKRKMPLPGAIIVAFDAGHFDSDQKILEIPKGSNVGWVIDGQHRLAGSHEAAKDGTDIELPVVAFLALSVKQQIEQFVIINREAKSVPTSLYLDLLDKLPYKKPADAARERAVDIGNQLRRNEDSVFFQRIVVMSSPGERQISLVNFVRKISPFVTPDKGLLHVYTEPEQEGVIENYFKALSIVFPQEFSKKNSVFFKTVGFGALWNVFPNFFNVTLREHQGFRVRDAVEVFKKLSSFDFDAWRSLGSGNQAEISAGDDIRTALLMAFRDDGGREGTLRL